MKNIENFSWMHDDGIFRYRNPLVWEPIQPIIQSAREVIAAFWERDAVWRKEAGERRIAWEALPEAEQKKPWVTNPPPPRVRKAWERLTPEEIRAEEEYLENLVETRNRQPGRFRKVWTDVGNRQTGVENQQAADLGTFPSPREPDYSDLPTAGYYHESFCWTIALRSAFRVLDLSRITDEEFPFGWVHVECPPDHPNHVSLMASASFQMGLYLAKAQAMQRVPQIHRASKMTRSRKGKINPLGETILQACAEMHTLGLPLQGNKASLRLLQFLAHRGRAVVNESTIDGQHAPSWKIGKLMKQFRDANGLSFGKTRSAKAVK